MPVGEASCPVCSLPAGRLDRCAECGWELRTDWRQGRADRSGFAAALQEAVLDHDLRVAARLDEDWKPYAAWLRGVPDEAAWTRARTRQGPPVRPLRPLLARVLPALGAADSLAVFETDAEGVAVTLVRAGELEQADRSARHGVTWRELVPMLAQDPAERRFQLAGGLAGLDRATLEAVLRQRLTRWAEGLAEGMVRIAVCRAPGWTLPEQAVRSLGSMTARETGRVQDALDGIRAELPLRVPYGLLVAAVNPDRTVRMATRPLFAAGTRPGTSARAGVRCVEGGVAQDTVLAVVTEEPARRLVSAWSGPLDPGGAHELEVLLEAPGRVRLVRPGGMAADPRSLAELERLAPARLDLRAEQIELVCLLELNGRPEPVARRRELLSGLFELLAREAPGRVSAAVLGYGEHFAAGRKHPAVLHGDWLRPLPEAREVLDALPDRATGFYPNAAPLEDALHEVVDRGARDPFAYSRVLLVLAGRTAHPPSTPLLQDVDRPAHACLNGLDWQDSAARLDFAAKVTRRFAVLDRLDEAARAEPLWRELGRDLLVELPKATPRRLAVDMNLIPADPVRCPFPLADVPAR
ncbi:hypothetical protein [Actinocorallia populi]|uniref:hypothetical protein n=1 Tax=Actinocorallia populi TaxID=2079200 RepID=UPI0013005A87|nr:hypothetical protein [Actinocorallia populi]